jgi:CelD/BcsL family acetyltransferase involved in cellulose biosynthesis
MASWVPQTIDARVLTTDDELVAISGEWSALCDRCAESTPFQRPDWLLPWRRQFGHEATPRVIALRRDGRLVGLVPLELRSGTLRLIGAGITDYLDAIVEPGLELSPYVQLALDGVRAIELDGLRAGSPLLSLELGGTADPGMPSPVVSLRERRIPPRLAYDRRRLARAGQVRWDDETTDRSALLEGLFVLHRARWELRGERGVLDAPALERFHDEAARGLHTRGMLRLVGLRLDGRLIGVLHGLSDHGRFLFYLSGFLPEAAQLSPGRLLIAHAMDRALDEGATEFDFLRGREAYKYEWGAVDQPAAHYRAVLSNEPAS